MKCELYHDNFQNFKRYNIPKAQIVIADIPYNIGADAYASNPMWYQGGDNKNGESRLAKQSFFHTDGTFRIAEYMHFCNRLLRKEPKEKGQAPAMIVFCAFEQMQTVIAYGKRYGFMNSYPLFFCKNYSAQVLKANMKIVGATEFAVALYRDKLPKFRNGREYDQNGRVIRGTGHMVFNWFSWERDGKNIPKIHPTQKPVSVLKRLIEVFTDPVDVVIDPVAGSANTWLDNCAAGVNAAIWEVASFPAADVVPVVHARWIYEEETFATSSGYCCSACRRPRWLSPDVPEAFKYCPNCGAKMDGGA